MSTTIEYMSPEWFKLRRGMVTASRFKDILAKPRSPHESSEIARKFGIDVGWSASAFGYALEIAISRHTDEGGPGPDDFRSDDMQWGIDNEPKAIEAYESRTFTKVHQPGLITKEGTIIGCTPDGFVGAKGGLEVKCPKLVNHVQIVMTKAVPHHWWPQIQGCLWVTGRDWWDFASFSPLMPEGKKLVVVRCMRDERFITNLSMEVIRFVKMIDQLEAKLLAA